ncbi:hypothetical protein C0416_00905 [bacterium]|nr:hypothetical protein [bacterium]
MNMKKTLHEEMLDVIEQEKKKGDKNIGMTVGNGVLLVKKIGEGAMGAVYLGYEPSLDRQVAVKVLLKEFFKDERQYEMLKRLLVEEGRNLAKLAKLKTKNPGIIEVYGLDENFPALIMELIEDGEDLQSFLYKRQDEWTTTGFRLWFLGIMEQIASALGAAHAQGVVHKDLKFNNVMIFKSFDGEWRIKIIDFGIAQNLTRVKLTHGVTLLGTPSYMAPEQWDDHWSLDARADVYSFGIMLYEILLQQDFHQTEDHESIMANAKDSIYVQKRVGHLPIDQRVIFEFLLAVEKSKRAGGMLEVLGALRSLRLAIMHRDHEAPGTSFPAPPEISAHVQHEQSHKVMEAAKEAFEESLETPAPVHVPSVHPVPSVYPAPPVPNKPVSRMGTAALYVEKHTDHPPAQIETGPIEAFDEEAIFSAPNVVVENHKMPFIPIIIALIIIVGGISYFLFFMDKGGDESGEKKEAVATVTEKDVKAMEPDVKVMEPKVEPKKVEPQMVPTEVPIEVKEPRPSVPTPPTKVGEFPSDQYATYMFREWDKWCADNDPLRAKFAEMPMLRAQCLRKKAEEFYAKDRSNPETAIGLLDETFAQVCSYSMIHRKQGAYIGNDMSLAKECATMEFLYGKFTNFIAGKRIHAVDKFLTDRRPRRLQIQEEWKKANSTENPPTTP